MSGNKGNAVTLLHKGQGPSLFQYRSAPRTIPDLGGTPQCSPRRDRLGKRTIPKCVDRQDANTMFARRLVARGKRVYRPKTPDPAPKSNETKVLFFQNKPKPFPPPTFLPRWNPRHKDRTYLDKMFLEDPWSLPPEKRAELQRKTGMRLKTISRHYQFKVGMNLPFGKAALKTGQCHCFVEFCQHCNADHTRRCPLHMQMLEGAEADCRTAIWEFCPYRKNPEDMPLDKIKDVSVYISEVVRRLRAGELSEPPPFPERFLKSGKQLQEKNLKPAVESSSALDFTRKVETLDSVAQTEPFLVDIDMRDAAKETVCQTEKPKADIPLLNTKRKPLEPDLPLISYGNYIEKETQVTPFMIVGYEVIADKFTTKLVTAIMSQSLIEIRDETVLHNIETHSAGYVQQLCDIQRSQHFRLIQEQFRNAAYAQEEVTVLQETMMEASAETGMGATLFSQVFLRNSLKHAMEKLQNDGFLVNADLAAIDEEFKKETNLNVEKKLNLREDSRRILDDIIVHSLADLEMDYFMGRVVSERFLDPLKYSTRQLVSLLRMREENLKALQKIKELLDRIGWRLPTAGETSEPEADAEADADEDLGAFLKKLRVSVDPEGNPKYLIDQDGRPLPINVMWLPYLTSHAQQDTSGKRQWDSTKVFDIVLSKESFSTVNDKETDQGLSESFKLPSFSSGFSGDTQYTKNKSKDDAGEFEFSFDDEDAESDEGNVMYKLFRDHGSDGSAL